MTFTSVGPPSQVARLRQSPPHRSAASPRPWWPARPHPPPAWPPGTLPKCVNYKVYECQSIDILYNTVILSILWVSCCIWRYLDSILTQHEAYGWASPNVVSPVGPVALRCRQPTAGLKTGLDPVWLREENAVFGVHSFLSKATLAVWKGCKQSSSSKTYLHILHSRMIKKHQDSGQR